MRAVLFDEYAKALFGESKKVDVLGVARPLTKFMFDLDDYTKKTRRLSATTLKVREAFFLSKSPEKLLLTELPAACGFADSQDVEGLSEQLIQSLRELKGAYPGLLNDMQVALCEAFHIPQDTRLNELREILRGRVHGLDRYTVDVKGLKAFIRRIGQRADSNDEWLTTLLLFIGHKPAAKWTDQDRDAAEYRLSEFARRLLDLEKLRQHDEKNASAGGDLDIILIKSLQKGGEEIDEIVSMSDKIRTAISESRERIQSVLDELNDNELRLALIADLTHEFLAGYRKSQMTGSSDSEEGAADAG